MLCRVPIAIGGLHLARRFVLAAIALAAVASPAAAETICTVERLASLDLLMTPETKAVFVAVTLNGTTKYLAVDTGGVMSTLTAQVAHELGLSMEMSRFAEQNLAGQSAMLAATVDRFGLGPFPPGHMQFLVLPAGDRTLPWRGIVAGTLAPNILRQYDVEFDFANAKMNLFKPNHCISGPYWDHATAASIPLTVSDNGHIFFPMYLDGKDVHSALDTGMSVTALRRDTAEKLFGINPAPGTFPVVTSLTHDERGAVYAIALHSLATQHNEIAITNPHMHLMPDLSTGRRLERDPDLILGLSTLRHLHFYIAYQQRKLFVTEASGPPAVTVQWTDLVPAQAGMPEGNSLRGDPPMASNK